MAKKIMTKEKAERLKKIKRILCSSFIFLFVVCIAVVGVATLVSPKSEYSESEKRELASFPKLTFESFTSGSFFDDLGVYISDNFLARDGLVETNLNFRELFGIRGEESIKFYEGYDNNNEEAEEEKMRRELIKLQNEKMRVFVLETLVFLEEDKKKPTQEVYEPDIPDDPNVVGEMRGSLFVLGDKALEVFGGSTQAGKNYANVLNKYKETLGDGVTVYNLLIPTHIEYALTDKYRNQFRSQRPQMENIYENLRDDIVVVDIYDTFKNRYKKGDYLYFRSDHHWTGLGGYYAYTVFAKQAGFDAIPLDQFEKREHSPFLGTLYQSTKDVAVKNNPDTVEYYVYDVPYKQINTSKEGVSYAGQLFARVSGPSNGYLIFMGGDWPKIKITTENTNGRKILVFKESYGNAFIPYLVPHYSEVHVADIRSFPDNAINYIRENGITEVLFINGMFSANTTARINDTLSLMTK